MAQSNFFVRLGGIVGSLGIGFSQKKQGGAAGLPGLRSWVLCVRICVLR